MDNRGYQPKNFRFARELRSNNSRKIHPINEETNTISDQSSHAVPQSSDQLLNSSKTAPRTKNISSKVIKSTSSSTSVKGLLLAAGITSVIICIIVIPSVLGVVLSRNPSMVSTTTTTTVAPPYFTAYWSFDSHTNDLYGVYNGSLLNGATYSNNTYFGLGFNLALNDSMNQSIIVSSPFLNLSYTSFTLEAWIFGYSFSGDNSIFSQCECTTCQDRCLFLIIRNNRMYMGFTTDDVVGITTMTTNTWHHVAFVYDYSTLTESIYLQGVLENSKSSSGPYIGRNGSTFIGSSHLSSGTFHGLIDNVRLTTRAKSAAEVLDAASIVVYFSFDGPTLSEDMGPNKMNGTISNAAAVTGRIGQGLAFSGAVTSYLQIYGFYQLGRSNQPFSFSLWLYPYSVTGGALIQKSTYANGGGWCYNFIGMNYLGQISMITYSSNTVLIVGPVLPVRSWTHLGYTFSTTNGLRMYINGVLFGTTGPTSFSSSGTIDWLSIGSYVTSYCGTGSGATHPVPYQGVLDEFYVFRRELTASQVAAYANL